jgi:RNA binding exosome subunit|tara:strand:- start:8705 stop:9082 length:378 start_codon:yes stop_codon:yes gene_type:complete
MKKEEVEKLFDMLDNVFNNINSKNKSTGTGLHFGYKLNVVPANVQMKKPILYTFELSLREANQGERILQTFSYEKPESYDLYTMKHQVMQSVITVMFESTMLQWNELGKLLNTDQSLQKAAIILK